MSTADIIKLVPPPNLKHGEIVIEFNSDGGIRLRDVNTGNLKLSDIAYACKLMDELLFDLMKRAREGAENVK